MSAFGQYKVLITIVLLSSDSMSALNELHGDRMSKVNKGGINEFEVDVCWLILKINKGVRIFFW